MVMFYVLFILLFYALITCNPHIALPLKTKRGDNACSPFAGE
jgi:hypothetical protein